MREARHTIVLPSGKTLDAFCGIVGIDADLNVTEGYESGLRQWVNDTDPRWREAYPELLTAGEQIELCDLLIDRWTRLKAKFIEAKP